MTTKIPLYSPGINSNTGVMCLVVMVTTTLYLWVLLIRSTLLAVAFTLSVAHSGDVQQTFIPSSGIVVVYARLEKRLSASSYP